jgi:hypothetical protein
MKMDWLCVRIIWQRGAMAWLMSGRIRGVIYGMERTRRIRAGYEGLACV